MPWQGCSTARARGRVHNVINSSRRLVLVRHAKSDRDAAGPDHERPLAPRGRRDAVALGRHLAQQPPVDLVLCSTALRARQTWDLAAQELAQQPPVEHREALSLASPSTALELVREVGDDVRALLLVGHEPTWSALVEQL